MSELSDRIYAVLAKGMLDDYAHAHGNYVAFLNAAAKERLLMETLDAEMTEVRGKIEIAKGVEQFYERHTRLNESLIYHSGREMGLT